MLVSPALVRAAAGGLILGDEIEAHAKGMREAHKCRELLGHEAHTDLTLEEEVTTLKTLAEPVPIFYVQLTDKHLGEQMLTAILVSLSHRRAVIETTGPLVRYANIMLRLEMGAGEEEDSEFYAKVIRRLDESNNWYLIHFTSVPPGMRERLNNLANLV